MSLSETRRNMRIMALENAAEMIRGHLELGASADELGITEEEFNILEEENKKVGDRLMAMAEKLKK